MTTTRTEECSLRSGGQENLEAGAGGAGVSCSVWRLQQDLSCLFQFPGLRASCGLWPGRSLSPSCFSSSPKRTCLGFRAHPNRGPSHLKILNLTFFSFFFLGPHLWHVEVPRLVVESELQLLASARATATQGPSRIWDYAVACGHAGSLTH